MKPLATAVALLVFAAPLAAQGIDATLPRLTWPDDGVTTSTKSCTVTTKDRGLCILQK